MQDSATGTWIAALISTNLETLASETATAVFQRVPFYRSLGAAGVQAAFADILMVLTQVFPAGDLQPLSLYLERVVPRRLVSGAAADALIEATAIIDDQLCRLISREMEDQSARIAEAIRSIHAVNHAQRMMISEINLRLLTGQFAPVDDEPLR